MAKWNLGWLGLAPKSWNKKASEFFTGSEEEKKSRLRPEQEQLYSQLMSALQGQGAGGAYGSVADYYRDLLSPDSQTAQAMFAPEMRNFNEQIIPGISEQFAGMGSGALSSSGFRNAAVTAGTDLQERLAAIRAQLKAQGAQGMAGLANQGFGEYDYIQPGTGGFIQSAGPLAASAVGAYFGGPPGAAAAYQASNQWLNNSNKGQSNPYGGAAQGAMGGVYGGR